MHVISYSRTVKRGEAYSFVEQVSSLGELLARADVISLHLPENGNTHVINKETIARMRDGVILINTARGILIDEAALAEALKSGKVRAARSMFWRRNRRGTGHRSLRRQTAP